MQIDRLARLTAPRSPLAIADFAVLPAQLHLMSNSCFTVGSHCFSAQTPALQERDIRGSCAGRGKLVGAQHVAVCPGLPRLSFSSPRTD